MIEQGIMTWLPTFNDKVLHLPENIRIMIEAAHENKVINRQLSCHGI
jgi:hypothetical protein